MLHKRPFAGNVVVVESCWEWIGNSKSKGYGKTWHRGRWVMAHRLAYEMSRGPIAEGMCVCHRCDNPRCVNPDHLWIGTCEENEKDKQLKGRSARGEKNGNSKLSFANVIDIMIAVFDEDTTAQSLANRFCITRQTVWDIRRGRTWKHKSPAQ